MLTYNDLCHLNEDIEILFREYIKDFLQTMAHPSWENAIVDNITDVLMIQCELYTDTEKKQIRNHIKHILNTLCYTRIIPKRSYRSLANKQMNASEHAHIKAQITFLENIELPAQRTPGWYLARWNMITASNAWKCFGSPAQQNSIIFEKCKPLTVPMPIAEQMPIAVQMPMPIAVQMPIAEQMPMQEPYPNVNTPMQHGVRYEQVSVMYYEHTYKTRVGDFGCMPHQTYSFLGASPDGINVDEGSDLYGVMLEIKNIYNREITGIPKLEYWVQMQMQMEICNLNRCDFLEMRVKEYVDEDAFRADGTFQLTDENKQKGVVMHFNNKGVPHYEYLPYNADENTYNKWMTDTFAKNDDKVWLENRYWWEDMVSLVRVVRNRQWFESVVPDFKRVWETIKEERTTGYEHRGPKKRVAKPELPTQVLEQMLVPATHVPATHVPATHVPATQVPKQEQVPKPFVQIVKKNNCMINCSLLK